MKKIRILFWSTLLLVFSLYSVIHADGLQISIEINPVGKPISDSHFAAGAGFYLPGIYYGTLPPDNPENKREEFAEALKKSGIRALRFPNGNTCQYYLFEGRDATWEVKSDKGAFPGGGWHPDTRPEDNHYVNVYDFLRFCKDYDIGVIYELPTFFYYDGKQPRAITHNDKVGKTTRTNLYDHDRIEEAVKYSEPLVKFCKDNQINVLCWEFGNEEFAHIPPSDFARIIKAYTELLDKYYDNSPIAFALQGGPPETEDFQEVNQIMAGDKRAAKKKHKWEWWPGWVENLLAEFTKLGMKERLNRPEVAGTIHYAFLGDSKLPEGPEQKKDHNFFLTVGLGNNETILGSPYVEAGYDRMSVGVTETNAARNRKWMHNTINPSFAYALSYVQYWILLLKQPKVTIISHHEIETIYFGLMRYGVIFDPEAREFRHIDRLSEVERAQVPKEHWFGDRYVLSGTCYANALLSKLAGCRLDRLEISTGGESKETLEANNIGAISGTNEKGRRVFVMYNKTAQAFPVTIQFPDEKKRTQSVLTATSIASMLELEISLVTTELQPSKVVELTLPVHSVVAIEE